MTKFARDTAVRRIEADAFEARVDPAWRIIRGANGGHLAAIVLRAMIARVEDPARTPRSLTVHFTRVPQEAPVRIETTIERSGRTLDTLSARMTQDDKLIALGVAAFSTARSGPEFLDLAMPEVPMPEDVDPVRDREDFPFGHHFDFRPVLGPRLPDSPQAMAEPEFGGERAEIGLWMRLREPEPTDHVVVTQLMDAFAPAVFAKLGTGGGGAGVPTVEMTYHYRSSLPPEDVPVGDWYLAVFRSTAATDGFVEEDGWLWTRTGRLLAQSRQLALLMTP